MPDALDYETLQLGDDRVSPATLTVVGVGGSGCNTVTRLLQDGVGGVRYLALNTDAQALAAVPCRNRVQLGADLTRGLGSGGDPRIGQQAAEGDAATLRAALAGSDMVFVTGGMGGGTGTGAAPIVAGLARDMGILTVGVVTEPFAFEGKHRQRIAAHGIAQLCTVVDTLIVLPNERLLHAAGRSMTLDQAFWLVDRVLLHGIRGMVDLVQMPGIINVDFADVRTIMHGAGTAWIGMGYAHGDDAVARAVQHALHSPLITAGIGGAHGVLCHLVGGTDLGINDIHVGVSQVTAQVAREANIIVGAALDPTMPADAVRVTVIATGFARSQPVCAPLPARASVPPPAAERAPPAPAPRRLPALPARDALELPAFVRRRARPDSAAGHTASDDPAQPVIAPAT